MKRHSIPRLILLVSFTFIWLATACIPGMRTAETPDVVTAPSAAVDETAETPGVIGPAAEIIGRWRANIEVPEYGAEMELILNIRQSADGSVSASLDIPIAEFYDIPITFSYDDGVVHWEIPDYGSTFNGRLIDSSTIEGTSTDPMGGPATTITFKRVE